MIARRPCFESLLAEAFDQIRQNAAGNVAVLTHLLHALETIAGQTASARRRQALRQQADLIAAVAERTIASDHDGAGVKTAWVRLYQALDAPSFRPSGSPSGAASQRSEGSDAGRVAEKS